MREVTIKVFSYDELKGKAKEVARDYLCNRLYGIEETFARLSLRDMIERVIEESIYQVPKGIPDNDIFSYEFTKILESKGVKVIKGKT